MTAQTRKELAARAGISTRTLQRWLEPHKACGKTYGRIEHVDILDTLDLAKHIQRHGSIFARLPEPVTLKENDYALHQRPTKKDSAPEMDALLLLYLRAYLVVISYLY